MNMETKINQIQVGLKNKISIKVTHDQTAEALGSGLLPVFATPAMVALIEGCAKDSVLPFLDQGYGTVGTLVNIQHLAATLMGKQVSCETIVSSIDRKCIRFEAVVTDEDGVIGRGTHERMIIHNGKFMAKLKGK